MRILSNLGAGIAAAATALVVSATASLSQPYEFYDSYVDWKVYVNKATNGCFMEWVTDDGIIMQIGSVLAMTNKGSAEDYGYLGVYLPGQPPADLDTGKPAIFVKVGPNAYIGRGQLLKTDTHWGGAIVSDGQNDLAYDLQNRREMEITTQNGRVVNIILNRTDISRGVSLTRECMAKNNP